MKSGNSFGNLVKPVKSSLWLELTPHCNLSCHFCYNPWRPAHVATYTIPPSPDSIVSRVRRLTDRIDFSYIALSGGEPLLYYGLERVVSSLAPRAKWTVLTTNGVHFSRSRANALRNAGLTSVQIPIMAASSDIHDEISGGVSWRQAIRALALSLQIGFSTSATFVLTRQNMFELAKVIVLLADLGVRRLIVNRLQIGGSAIANSGSLDVDIEDRVRIAGEVSELASRKGVDLVKVPSERLNDTDPQLPTAWGRWSLAPDGSLKFCNLSELSIGLIDELSDEFLDNVATDLAEGRILSYRNRINNCACLDEIADLA